MSGHKCDCVFPTSDNGVWGCALEIVGETLAEAIERKRKEEYAAYQKRLDGAFPMAQTFTDGSIPVAHPPRFSKYGYKAFDDKKNYWYLTKTEGEEPHWVDVKNFHFGIDPASDKGDWSAKRMAIPTADYNAIWISKHQEETARSILESKPEEVLMGEEKIYEDGLEIVWTESGEKKLQGCSHERYVGDARYVWKLTSNCSDKTGYRWGVYRKEDNMCISSCSGHYIKAVDFNNKTKGIITNIMDKFIALFESEPIKSYKKAGIYDANGVPTPNGIAMFVKYVLDSKSELATAFQTDVVAKLIAEQEKESKK